jgi:hypothetical protein
MKDQNNVEILNSFETHNKKKHQNNKWNVWFLKTHNRNGKDLTSFFFLKMKHPTQCYEKFLKNLTNKINL